MPSVGLLIGEFLVFLMFVKLMVVPGAALWGFAGAVGCGLLAYHQYRLIRESIDPTPTRTDWREPVYPVKRDDQSER